MIGLALGGGSARGWAHIGVIRALVGAAYVGGELNRLESWASSLHLQAVVSFLDFSLGSGLIKRDKLIEFSAVILSTAPSAIWRVRLALSPPICGAVARCGCARDG